MKFSLQFKLLFVKNVKTTLRTPWDLFWEFMLPVFMAILLLWIRGLADSENKEKPTRYDEFDIQLWPAGLEPPYKFENKSEFIIGYTPGNGFDGGTDNPKTFVDEVIQKVDITLKNSINQYSKQQKLVKKLFENIDTYLNFELQNNTVTLPNGEKFKFSDKMVEKFEKEPDKFKDMIKTTISKKLWNPCNRVEIFKFIRKLANNFVNDLGSGESLTSLFGVSEAGFTEARISSVMPKIAENLRSLAEIFLKQPRMGRLFGQEDKAEIETQDEERITAKNSMFMIVKKMRKILNDDDLFLNVANKTIEQWTSGMNSVERMAAIALISSTLQNDEQVVEPDFTIKFQPYQNWKDFENWMDTQDNQTMEHGHSRSSNVLAGIDFHFAEDKALNYSLRLRASRHNYPSKHEINPGDQLRMRVGVKTSGIPDFFRDKSI